MYLQVGVVTEEEEKDSKDSGEEETKVWKLFSMQGGKKDAFPLGTKLKAVAPYLTYPRLSGVMLPAEVDEV